MPWAPMMRARATVAPTNADTNGAWSVGGDFGAMIVEDIPFDVGAGPIIPTGTSQIDIDHDYGYDGALFVGYDLGAVRLEAEVGYRRAQLDQYETVIALPGLGNPSGSGAAIPARVADAGGGSTSALSFMLNGMFDFGDEDGISGFVGGGVGIARVSYNNLRAFSNQGPFLDDSDTGFAWQVVAGVRQAISDNIDVTLRYRRFNVDDVRTVNWRGQELGGYARDEEKGGQRLPRAQSDRSGSAVQILPHQPGAALHDAWSTS